MLTITPQLLQGGLPRDAREDNCLLLRAEICREAVGDSNAIELYGYGVVLGSDNALLPRNCYFEKKTEHYTIFL